MIFIIITALIVIYFAVVLIVYNEEFPQEAFWWPVPYIFWIVYLFIALLTTAIVAILYIPRYLSDLIKWKVNDK